MSAELLKLATTRMARGLLATALALTLLLAGVTVLTARNHPVGAGDAGGLVTSASLPSILALVLGILAMAGEFRHHTITPTFLAAPRRSGVIVAKLVACALAGLVMGAVTTLAALAVALPWMSARGIAIPATTQIARAVTGTLIAGALYGLVGVGVGALVRNQVAAIVIAVLWVQFLEAGVLGLLAPAAARWLPAGASLALTSPGGAHLSMLTGGLVFAGYGLLFALAGIALMARRDIT